MRMNVLGVASLLLLAGTSLAQNLPCSDFRFNQTWLEQRWQARTVQYTDVIPSAPQADAQREGTRPAITADFDNAKSVLRAVLQNLPAEPVVYPTEGYFYYKFQIGARTVSGNLRFIDADTGTLHVGYFDDEDNAQTRYHAFTAADGLMLSKVAEDVWDLAFDGLKARFRIARADLAPQATLKPVQGESVVSGILDESGNFFTLMWYEPKHAFYYVLNTDRGLTETFTPTSPGSRYRVGSESRYIVFDDQETGRMVLVGVKARNIRDNNYFDGPFDQVPPRLAIRAKLYAAYPYSRGRGGLDEHGNFVDLDGQRVAISPYVDYDAITAGLSYLETRRKDRTSGPELWSDLTYEYKRDFAPGDPGATTLASYLNVSTQSRSHATFMSQGWPANHTASNSRSWPTDHNQSASRAWPANHMGGVSSEGPDESRGVREAAPAAAGGGAPTEPSK